MLNKVFLMGNLGQDPEIRATKAGKQVCNFSIATSRTWRDKEGNKQESTEWHRIVVWGPAADNCSKYLNKGNGVLVEGRLETRQWEGSDGTKRTTTEIVADDVKFLPRGNSDGQRNTYTPDKPAQDSIPF